MKYLIIVLVVLALLWWVRRHGGAAGARPQAPRKQAHDTMLPCAHCGLHIPRDEALPGRGGVFCGEAHRAAYEQAHPRR